MGEQIGQSPELTKKIDAAHRVMGTEDFVKAGGNSGILHELMVQASREIDTFLEEKPGYMLPKSPEFLKEQFAGGNMVMILRKVQTPVRNFCMQAQRIQASKEEKKTYWDTCLLSGVRQ